MAELKKSWLIYLSLIAVLVFAFTTNGTHKYWKGNKVIEWDVKSYYAYLPATFIFNDLSLEFLEENPEMKKEIWPVELENGNKLIITSTGMSYLYLPFFLSAHTYASFSDYEANGYSLPYRLAIVIGGFIFLIIGLLALKKLLQLFYYNTTTALVLLAVGLGTNLYYYATYEAGMTHVYNFTLITIFLYQTVKWHRDYSWKRLIFIGLLGGLITLIRPTNIIIYLLFALWDVKSIKGIGNRFLFFIKKPKVLILLILLFLIPWIPQFIYWKIQTGQLLFFSYGEAGASFYFNNPQIFKILFSYRKGWFVYTPIMFFAFIGLLLMIRKRKEHFIPIFSYLCFMIYLLASWWSWWFGGGFGNRAFIDFYGVMSIPLAFLFQDILKSKVLKISLASILIALTAFNYFQIKQYNNLAIHYWGMTKEMYWETFLKLKPSSDYFKMIRVPNYEKARQGIYEEVIPEDIKQKYYSIIDKDSLFLRQPNAIFIDKKKEKIINNKALLSLIEAKAEAKKITLDEAIDREIMWLLLNDSASIFENKVYNKMDLMRKDEAYYNFLLEKAKKENSPIETILYKNASWVLIHKK
jgi:hypothetical protein